MVGKLRKENFHVYKSEAKDLLGVKERRYVAKLSYEGYWEYSILPHARALWSMQREESYTYISIK